jgi:hypothetical protein
MVTHEPEIAEQCQRIVRLRDGVIMSDTGMRSGVGTGMRGGVGTGVRGGAGTGADAPSAAGDPA